MSVRASVTAHHSQEGLCLYVRFILVQEGWRCKTQKANDFLEYFEQDYKLIFSLVVFQNGNNITEGTMIALLKL